MIILHMYIIPMLLAYTLFRTWESICSYSLKKYALLIFSNLFFVSLGYLIYALISKELNFSLNLVNFPNLSKWNIIALPFFMALVFSLNIFLKARKVITIPKKLLALNLLHSFLLFPYIFILPYALLSKANEQGLVFLFFLCAIFMSFIAIILWSFYYFRRLIKTTGLNGYFLLLAFYFLVLNSCYLLPEVYAKFYLKTGLALGLSLILAFILYKKQVIKVSIKFVVVLAFQASLFLQESLAIHFIVISGLLGSLFV